MVLTQIRAARMLRAMKKFLMFLLIAGIIGFVVKLMMDEA